MKRNTRKSFNMMLVTLLIPGYLVMSNDVAVKADALPSIESAFGIIKGADGNTKQYHATSSDSNSYSVDLSQLNENDRFTELHILGNNEVEKIVVTLGFLGEKEVIFENNKISISPGDFDLDPQGDGITFGILKEFLDGSLSFDGTLYSTNGVTTNISVVFDLEGTTNKDPVIETEDMKNFRESAINETINIGAISAKKVNENEALVTISGTLDSGSLGTTLINLSNELKVSFGKEVDVQALTHTDVVEGESTVVTNLDIPFALINKDTNTVKLMSSVESLPVKIIFAD